MITQDSSVETQQQIAMDDDNAWKIQYQLFLTQLATQIEYYFSENNLAKDTYLQTLRSLNDGCVPANIIANFTKVKQILYFCTDEQARLQAVLHVATEVSKHLRVVMIDTNTGKECAQRNEQEQQQQHAILAIGTKQREPLQSNVLYNSNANTTNTQTIILRDMHPEITEQEVKTLFDFDTCPAILSLHCDVANCWFITLDTLDRNVLVYVLQYIQTLSLRDYPVHARLKATPANIPIDAFLPVWEPSIKQKKKKTRSKKKNKKKKKNVTDPKKQTTAAEPTLSLSEDNFPTLQDEKVLWETQMDHKEYEEEHGKSSKSDAASTATTTSSSTESGAPKNILPAGGYAAAVLKKVTAVTNNSVTDRVVAHQTEESSNRSERTTTMSANSHWESRPSFAEILREPATSQHHNRNAAIA